MAEKKIKKPTKKLVETLEEIVEPIVEPVEEWQEPDWEVELLKAMIQSHRGMPTFAIIRDAFDNTNNFDPVIRDWIVRDYYIVIPPGNNIRDGYLTDSGRLYARNKFNIV